MRKLIGHLVAYPTEGVDHSIPSTPAYILLPQPFPEDGVPLEFSGDGIVGVFVITLLEPQLVGFYQVGDISGTYEQVLIFIGFKNTFRAVPIKFINSFLVKIDMSYGAPPKKWSNRRQKEVCYMFKH